MKPILPPNIINEKEDEVQEVQEYWKQDRWMQFLVY